ncbi:MAG: response regulator [Bacteroidota bacterium]|jgi:signal transduction histidine kinase/DNA-binding response OmpR family regulator/ligand-binding sensor domain-containing protein|nr:response regulator [Bacteroidota bacterium]
MQAIFIIASILLDLVTATVFQRSDFADKVRKNSEVVVGSEALSIRSITQDAKGMIWFGTDQNLYSYDGYHIRVHRDKNGNNDHFQINCLLSYDEHILLGCMDGIVIYDKINEAFETIDFFKGNEVCAFSMDKNGDIIWIGTDNGLFMYSIPLNAFSTAKMYSEDKPVNIWSLACCGDYLFIGMRGKGLGRYDLSGKHEYESVNIDQMQGQPTQGALIAVNDKKLMIGTARSLHEFDVETNKSRMVGNFSWVKTICRTGSSFLLGTDAGLFSYELESKKIYNIINTVVWCILCDKNGNIWLGSDNGLLVSKENKLINRVECVPENSNNLYSSVSGTKNGQIFAGGSYGLIVFNDKAPESSPNWYKMEDNIFPLRHNKIRKIAYNKTNDDIWVATAAGSLKYNKSTQQFDLFRVDNNSFYNAYDILPDEQSIWFATSEGLYHVRNDRIVRQYTVKDGLSSNRIAQVAKDRFGKIWARSMDRKIFTIDNITGKTAQFLISEQDNSIRGDQLFCDSEGNIWITSTNHAYKIVGNGSETQIKDYFLQGNPGQESKAIIEVNNTIWTSYSDGICILDKNSTYCRHIHTSNSYLGMYFDSRNQRVLLGSLDRIDAVYPKDVDKKFETSAANIYITSITAGNNKSVPYKDITSGKITLPHNYNNIVINFTNFCYDTEVTIPIRFKLKGRSSQWNEVRGSQNSLFLSELSHKTYRLYMAFVGEKDPENPLITISIKRPWYSSIAAKAIYTMLFIFFANMLISFILLRKKVRLERIQKAQEMSQVKSKINFFTDVAHEFKTPLSLIIAPVSKLIQNCNDNDEKKHLLLIHENAMKLNSLIHFSLDYYNDRKDVGNSIIMSTVEVVDFVKRIFQTYEENFPWLDFVFKSSYKEIHASLDVIKTETIISNIMSNACKYTPKGGSIIMMLGFSEPDRQLSINISDTGIGIPSEEIPFILQRYYQSSRTKEGHNEGTGLGLSIVKSYVDILKGKINVSSSQYGTTVMVTLPLKFNTESDKGLEEVLSISKNEQKPLIVIVDDNKSVCDFLVSLLTEEYNCLCAFNGKNGLKLCQEVAPDLIIADVVMPVMNGLEMCKCIRETPSLSIVPIILLTAKDDNETERSSINLNIDSFIAKPFDVDTLLAKVNYLIGHTERVEKQMRLKIITEPKNDGMLSLDEKFLINITRIIEDNLDDSDLSVTRLSELGEMNEKQLYRKIKSLTGLSTMEYVRSIRIKRAAQLLQNGNFTVSEVMYTVGYTNPSYFAKSFASKFGMTPKEYLYNNKKQVGSIDFVDLHHGID